MVFATGAASRGCLGGSQPRWLLAGCHVSVVEALVEGPGQRYDQALRLAVCGCGLLSLVVYGHTRGMWLLTWHPPFVPGAHCFQ